ncbi:hypothetical protein ABZS29_21845 [Kribbella sp. NPDC005582]|uniref:hypothetical protein n=1 Tax=Kribbella sp. NPDC005582 TaxID=3156893 RepID=UPI0033BD18E4
MGNTNAYDSGASGQVQSNLSGLAAQIQTLIEGHRKNVAAALADASATKVTDEYRQVEARFNKAADATMGLIKSLEGVMKANDGTASETIAKASSAVSGING